MAMGTRKISIVRAPRGARRTGIIAALTLAGVFAACASDSAPQSRTSKVEETDAGVVPACGSDETPTCPSTKPSYKTDITPILNSECNTCHIGGPTGPWPLSDYQCLLDWKLLVLADMVHCTMPPEDAGHKISDADRATLIGWLACGAPNN